MVDQESKEGVGRQSGRLGADGVGTASGSSAQDDTVRAAGRGFVLITGAKLWFMVMGAVVMLGLPSLMSPARFGVYSLVINAVSLANMVVITGTLQAVSKLVSERPHAARALVARGALLQCVVAVPLSLAWVLGSDALAALLNDPALGGVLAISGGIILAYGFYATFVGCLNGLKAFGRQAVLDIIFSTMKTVLILGAVLMGLGVAGALWGFVTAAGAVTFIALGLLMLVLRQSERDAAGASEGDVSGVGQAQSVSLGEDLRKLGSYLLLVMVYTFCVNGVLRADLFLLKGMIAGLGGEASVALSNEVSGFYSAALNVSRLPYQAVLAVTFVVFPMISKATFEDDRAATQAYIRGAMRYSLLMLALLGALLAGNAPNLVLALFGAEYASGAVPLMLLSVATVGFSLFVIATTMITGAGRPLVSVGIAALTLGLTSALNYGLLSVTIVPGAAAERVMLMASGATAVSMVVGFLVSLFYLYRRYEAGLPVLTVLRVLTASVLICALSWWVPLPEGLGRVPLLLLVSVKGLFGVAIFLGVLGLTGEFGVEDKARLSKVLKRG